MFLILGITSIPVSNVGRLAQRESAPLTRERSLVQTQHRPPLPQKFRYRRELLIALRNVCSKAKITVS